jgi:prepilin-type processing-associated H-X9-DG protein/prepilin-type N-terminal cleavage/methylation domain-containing protein
VARCSRCLRISFGACAFTLVELLVTLLVIAVLFTIAIAGARTVRDGSDAAKCVANLRQLASANLAYAGEHGGQYVPAQEPANLIRWHGVRDSLTARFDPTRGPLAPYLGEHRRIQTCPSLLRVLHGLETFEDGSGGYGYNATYIGGIPADGFTPERLANIPAPVRVIMFTDCAFARPSGLQEYAYSEPFQWVDYRGRPKGPLDPSTHFRHSKHANVAWCDGHITAEKWSMLGGENRYNGDSGKWKIGWFGPDNDNGYWNPQRP